MRKITATLFIGKKKKFYFHVQAKNRKIICQSEPYNTLQSAIKTVKLLQGGNDWNIVDLTKQK